jgi:hypothetical protein
MGFREFKFSQKTILNNSLENCLPQRGFDTYYSRIKVTELPFFTPTIRFEKTLRSKRSYGMGLSDCPSRLSCSVYKTIFPEEIKESSRNANWKSAS